MKKNKTKLSGTQSFMLTFIYVLQLDNDGRYILHAMYWFLTKQCPYSQYLTRDILFETYSFWWQQCEITSDCIFKKTVVLNTVHCKLIHNM